jgi:hypothetical protein
LLRKFLALSSEASPRRQGDDINKKLIFGFGFFGAAFQKYQKNQQLDSLLQCPD